MKSISVVIVCKNEAGIIAKTLESLEGLTDDVVVYDNGSTDDTIKIAAQFPYNIHEGPWKGFGPTKNAAIALAKHDWILSLDADEAIDEELKQSLRSLSLEEKNVVYEIQFKNFFGDQWLRHGEWGKDKHIRLFNRWQVLWNEAAVHEELTRPPGTVVKKLKGNVLHYTAVNIEKYKVKMDQYALMNGEKYFNKGKKAGPLRKYIASFFSFTQNYIFRAGFLDGKAGYQCARLTAGYTFKKYKQLEELLRQQPKEQKY